ncbi:MAG: MlaD family protein, partial [Candidatus Dormibacteraceae bacterium]
MRLRGRSLMNLGLVTGFAAVCLAGIFFLAANLGLHLPGRTPYVIRADFASAENLVPLDTVRVAGVNVGQVLSVVPDHSSGVIVAMAVDSSVGLQTDTRAVIRPKSQFGEDFVELVRNGASQAPRLTGNGLIPRSQTGQAVQIDSILNNLDPATRAAMTQSLRELGVATKGRAADINHTLGPLDQTVANLRPLAVTAEQRQQDIARILANLNTIMAALADEQAQLGQVVDSGSQTFGAIAARDKNLAGTVTQAATLLSSLDQSFKGATPADRQSLQLSPPTIAAGRQALALTNPLLDRLLTEVLTAQINYPSNQLNETGSEGQTLAAEWISAFAQHDSVAHSFRITSITGAGSVGTPQAAPAPASGSAAAPPAPG